LMFGEGQEKIYSGNDEYETRHSQSFALDLWRSEKDIQIVQKIRWSQLVQWSQLSVIGVEYMRTTLKIRQCCIIFSLYLRNAF
jgi:hypothetical protein